jgi:hypothetical protein
MVGKPRFAFTLFSFIDEKADNPAVMRFAEAVANAAVPVAPASGTAE